MSVVSMRELLEAGVHFGHQTRRWNPKMRRFIFTERGGIYIIDLQQTLDLVEQAYAFARNVSERGGSILFVGTKKQCQDAIAEEAQRVGMPYVNHRWLGGLLTNWRTISERIARLHELRRLRDEGQLELLPSEGAHLDDGRAREARGQPGRRGRHEVGARRGVRDRPAQGAARRARGAAARPAGDRARRHELRPRRRRLRHPRERRRHPLVQPDRARDRGRDRGREDQGHGRGDGRGRGSRRGASARAGGTAGAPARAEPAAVAAAPAPEPAATPEAPAEGGEEAQ